MADASVFVVILAAAGALAAGATALSRPLVALGILFLLASISRVTLETPVIKHWAPIQGSWRSVHAWPAA